MLGGLIFGIVLALILFFIASLKSGTTAAQARPADIISFTSSAAPEKILKAIARFAPTAGYSVCAVDEARGTITLEEGANMMSYGFFFPVFISPQFDGTTLVEVGLKKKMPQWGPLPVRAHEKCANGIKAALFSM